MDSFHSRKRSNSLHAIHKKEGLNCVHWLRKRRKFSQTSIEGKGEKENPLEKKKKGRRLRTLATKRDTPNFFLGEKKGKVDRNI